MDCINKSHQYAALMTDFPISFKFTHEYSVCLEFNYEDPIGSQFCTCHDSRAVVACAKMCPDLMIIFHRRATHIFTRILSQAPKLLVSWSNDYFPCKNNTHMYLTRHSSWWINERMDDEDGWMNEWTNIYHKRINFFSVSSGWPSQWPIGIAHLETRRTVVPQPSSKTERDSTVILLHTIMMCIQKTASSVESHHKQRTKLFCQKILENLLLWSWKTSWWSSRMRWFSPRCSRGIIWSEWSTVRDRVIGTEQAQPQDRDWD